MKVSGVLRRAWAAAPYALVAAVLVVIVVLTYHYFQHRAEVDSDASVVYCLAPARQDDLVNAAVALKLAEAVNPDKLRAGGVEMGPPLWRDRFPDDFTRACDALSAAQRPPGAGLFATVLPFLTGLVGAGVAFLAAVWRDRVARGRLLADDLRSGYSEFQRAVEAFLGAPIGSREATPVKETRAVVLTRLARARVVLPRWGEIDRARTELAEGTLDVRITQRWTAADHAREQHIRQALTRTQDTVARIANGLEKPFRSHWYSVTDRGGAA